MDHGVTQWSGSGPTQLWSGSPRVKLATLSLTFHSEMPCRWAPVQEQSCQPGDHRETHLSGPREGSQQTSIWQQVLKWCCDSATPTPSCGPWAGLPTQSPPGGTAVSVLRSKPAKPGLIEARDGTLVWLQAVPAVVREPSRPPGDWWRTFLSAPREPGLQTLAWATSPEAAAGLAQGQFCLPGTHPVTWQEPFQGLGRSHTAYGDSWAVQR